MRRRATFRTVLASLLLTAALLSGSAAGDERCKRDQDCALDAVERGEIRSFAEVLAFVRGQTRAQIVAVELEREDALWVYKMKVLTADGRRRKLEVDAKSLTILKEKDD